MVNKKEFPLDWEDLDEQIAIYLSDSTLLIDKDSYNKLREEGKRKNE